MNVLIVLVPVSLALAGLALGVFLWTLKSAQYDDLEGDAWRILSDDDAPDGGTPRSPAKDACDPERQA